MVDFATLFAPINKWLDEDDSNLDLLITSINKNDPLFLPTKIVNAQIENFNPVNNSDLERYAAAFDSVANTQKVNDESKRALALFYMYVVRMEVDRRSRLN